MPPNLWPRTLCWQNAVSEIQWSGQMLQFSRSSGLAKQEDLSLSNELNFNFPIACCHNYGFLCIYFICLSSYCDSASGLSKFSFSAATSSYCFSFSISSACLRKRSKQPERVYMRVSYNITQLFRTLTMAYASLMYILFLNLVHRLVF
jgi:hypothetical protein